MKRVEVVPYDPTWQQAFEVEAQQIAATLGPSIVALHHVGSTSIPGIWAKPIIDLLVEVVEIAQVDHQSPAMESIGYQAMGAYGIPGRRYFRKHSTAGTRTHHVHIFEVGSPEVERHLAFRDYLRAHPDDAQTYSDLKRQLAKAHPTDIEAYMDGKDSFIRAIDEKAAKWRSPIHG